MGRGNRLRAALITLTPLCVALHPVAAATILVAIVAISRRPKRVLLPYPLVALALSFTASAIAAGRFSDNWLVPLGLVLGALFLSYTLLCFNVDDRGPLVIGFSFLALVLGGFSAVEVLGSGVPRANAIFVHPNILGGAALVVGLFLVLGAAALKDPWHKWLARGAGLVAFVAVVLSGSRGAAVGVVVGIVIACVVAFTARGVGGRRSIVVMAVVVVTAGGGLFAFSDWLPVPPRFASAEEIFDSGDRLYLWSVGSEMLGYRPLLGFGPRGWSSFVSAFEPSIQSSRIGHSHNLFLEMALDGGLLGLLVLLWALAALFSYMLRERKTLGEMFPVGLAVTAGLLATNVTDVLFYQSQVLLLWWLALCAVFAARRHPWQQETTADNIQVA